MNVPHKLPGRLRGGLSRIRVRALDRARLWAFLRRHKSAWVRLGWNAARGVVGCGIGLLGVTLWLQYR
jgi:hypothetical protein